VRHSFAAHFRDNGLLLPAARSNAEIGVEGENHFTQMSLLDTFVTFLRYSSERLLSR
jgi:hypothetical protein